MVTLFSKPSILISMLFLSGCSKKSTEVTPSKSSAKALTEFKFQKSLNSDLDKGYSGTISGSTITVDFSKGLKKNALVASFSSSASGGSSVCIGTITPGKHIPRTSTAVLLSMKINFK